MGKQKSPEHDLQVSVFEWVREKGIYIFPELEAFRSITSGQPRYGWEINWFKAEGMEPGYPDTHLPVPRYPYCALWIEVKAGYGKPSDTQKERIMMLRKYGNCAVVRNDPNEIIWTLIDYLLYNPILDANDPL